MYKATKEFKWDMAHRLPTHWWKCFNVHWHTYKAQITIAGENLQSGWRETGMLKDFSNFKPIKERIDENRDHSYVSVEWDEVLDFLSEKGYKTFSMKVSPTAENMTSLLFEKCRQLLPWVEINKVVIYETPTSFAEFSLNNDLPF